MRVGVGFSDFQVSLNSLGRESDSGAKAGSWLLEDGHG